MNIIIVAKPFSTPRVVRLGGWRSWMGPGLALAAVIAVIGGVGAMAGAFLFGPAALKYELRNAQSQLDTQREELAKTRADANRDVNALALRLGRLSAESSRLNSLGKRLATMGKLDDGEFDFSREPALGGGPESDNAPNIAAPQIDSVLDRLEAQFGRQSEQLNLLESVLMKRELDKSLMPAGLPVASGNVGSGFGYRVDPINGHGEFHTGIDFDGDVGTNIMAVAGGVVSFSGVRAGYGNVVEIDHGNGYLTRYAHNSRNLVKEGQPVHGGEIIAKMGATGRATGSHVHFEVWRDGKVTNPNEYVRAIR